MLLIFLTFCVVISTIFGLKLLKFVRLWKSAQNFPGPPATLILGNALDVGLNPFEFTRSVFTWWQKYGPGPYRGWLLHKLFILIADPKDCERVLLSNPQLLKPEFYDFFRDYMKDGLINSSGSKWQKRRRLINPSFHFTILMDFFDVINKTSDVFIDSLRNKAESGEIFNIEKSVSCCALDIICETAMGVSTDSLRNQKSTIMKAYHDLFYVMLCRCFNIMETNDFLFRFTKNHKLSTKALNVVYTFITGVIEKRRQMLKSDMETGDENFNSDGNSTSRKKVFLDTLLTGTIDGQPLGDDEIYEEVATFIAAGHDTTASGLTFAIYCLSRNAEAQERAFDEQKLIFGQDLNRNPTFSELSDMKYLDCVIKETMRLFPSVPIIGRKVTEKFDLNGKEVLPGTTIVLLLIAMGYNEKNFTDPCKFQPDRFEDNRRNQARYFDYIPFSAGPRNCIGQKFAMIEMKCVLSKILRIFEILPASDDMPPFKGVNFSKDRHELEPHLYPMVTLKSDNGVKIRLRTRIYN